MLGIGSGAGRSGKVRKIVKNGLQAWYKCDATQAPLGEEEITNGDFSLGVEEVTNGSFQDSGDVNTTSQSLGWYQIDVNGGGASISGGELILNGGTHEDYSRAYITDGINASTLTAGKVYKLTYTVSSVTGSTDLEYHNGQGYNDATETVGTHTIYYTQTVGDYFIFRNNGADGSVVKLSNVSIQQTNPNDSWTLGSNWSMQDGVLTSDNSANAQASQDVLTLDKRYRITYTIASYTSGTMRCNAGTDNGTGRTAVGTYT